MNFGAKLISIGSTLAIGGLFVGRFFFTVDAGEKGLLFDRAF